MIDPEKPVKSTKHKRDIVNFSRHFDFVPITFHPFASAYSTPKEIQAAFDFLHKNIRKPIAISETAQIAQSVPLKDITLVSNQEIQKNYLDILFKNAKKKRYLYISYWAHRDCDALVETFPAALQELGKIIKDTGLIDENGNHRPSFNLWKNEFSKTYKK